MNSKHDIFVIFDNPYNKVHIKTIINGRKIKLIDQSILMMDAQIIVIITNKEKTVGPWSAENLLLYPLTCCD